MNNENIDKSKIRRRGALLKEGDTVKITHSKDPSPKTFFVNHNLKEQKRTELIEDAIYAWNCHDEDLFFKQATKECPEYLDFLNQVFEFLNQGIKK